MSSPTEKAGTDPRPTIGAPISSAIIGIRGRRLLVLLVLCSVFLVDVMGATSMLAATPSIGRALRLNTAELQWSLTAATFTAATLLMLGALLADRAGRRPMVIGGLAGSMLSWLVGGIATNTAVFIATRATLGASAALSVPAALALLTDTFSEEVERRKALAAWSAIGGIGSTAGLLLGGLVTAGLGWRWLFLTSGILCLPLVMVAAFVLSEPDVQRLRRGLYVRGLLSFGLGVAAVLYAISEVSSGRLLRPQFAIGAAGIMVLAWFAARQRRTQSPLIPPHLLRLRAIRSGNITLLVAGMLVDGLLFTLSLILQDQRGYTALQYGAVASVMTGFSAVGAGWAQRLVARFGARSVAVGGLIGLAFTAVSLATSFALHAPVEVVLASMLLFGAAMAAAFVAGSVESLSVTDERDNATAAALQNISFALGTALGVALVSAVAASVGHLGAHPLADSDPTRLLAGLRAALWAEAVVAVFGAGVLGVGLTRRHTAM